MAPGTFAAAGLPINEVWSWYDDQKTALIYYRKQLLEALLNGTLVEPKFELYNSAELETHFVGLFAELEHLTCFALIAATEGIVKADFEEKIRRKEKSALSRAFRDLNKKTNGRPRFEDDILELWKGGYPTHKQIFSDFAGALKYRHWLAHGRHWTAKVGRNYTTDVVYEITRKVATVVADPATAFR